MSFISNLQGYFIRNKPNGKKAFRVPITPFTRVNGIPFLIYQN